jgi:hypothetical protein
MSISIQCPQCEKKLKAKDESAGKRVKCPACGESIPVPAGQPVAAGKPPRPSAAKSAAPRKAEPKPTRQPAPQSRRVRWPWYAGGTAGLCIVAVVVAVFAMPGGGKSGNNEVAENDKKEPVIKEPAKDEKPEPAKTDGGKKVEEKADKGSGRPEPKKSGVAQFKSDSGKDTLTLHEMLSGKRGSSVTRRDAVFNRDYQVIPVSVAEKRQSNSDCLVLVFHVTSGFMPTVEGGGKCVLVANDKQYPFISASDSADYMKGFEMQPLAPGWLSLICTQHALDAKGQPTNVVLTFELPPAGSQCRLEGLKEFPSVSFTVP